MYFLHSVWNKDAHYPKISQAMSHLFRAKDLRLAPQELEQGGTHRLSPPIEAAGHLRHRVR